MYTVLKIHTSKSGATFFDVYHFELKDDAQEFRTREIEWNEDSMLYEGELSEDEAIAEYLD